MAKNELIKAEKGVKSLGSGRQKGTPNIVTQRMRSEISELAQNVRRLIEENNDLAQLDAKDRIDIYLKLMSFICPKPVEKADDNEGADVRAAMAIVLQSVKRR